MFCCLTASTARALLCVANAVFGSFPFTNFDCAIVNEVCKLVNGDDTLFSHDKL